MKKAPSVLLSILIFTSATNAVDFPGPAKAKTVVLAYSSYSWDSAAGWVELTNVKTITEIFDPLGRILAREIGDGIALIERTSYAYTDDGCRTNTCNSNNELTRYSEIITDDEKTLETIRRADGTVFAIFKTSTDARGLPIRTEHRDPSGALVWLIAYGYDVSGNCAEVSYFNPDGALVFQSSFAYRDQDAAGNWTVRTEYDAYAGMRSRPKDIVRRAVEYWE
jgi:hypothetical protein